METTSILSKLESSRKELLDLGLRNTLLNYTTPASKGVHIVHEKSALIYDTLVKQGKSMTFIGKSDKEVVQELEFPDLSLEKPEITHKDTKIQTNESEQKLQSRLLNTYYIANTNIEEQGVNILYLALGMLTWFESENSNEPIIAPLILIPVRLERSSAVERFKLKYSGEDIGANISLIEKMKEFDIKIPAFPDSEEFDLNKYFEKTQRAISRIKKWRIDIDAIELGFFSFGKFLIYVDLDNSKWPKDKKPVDNPLIQSLFTDGFKENNFCLNDESFIDTETNADELFQVVDADSSQILSILAAKEGKNLIIQGPPGTGKSQTITNIIADAVGRGKKVLFVAEKLAALEVVKRRMDNIALGVCCLELHSQKANKKQLHQELMHVVELGRPDIEQLQQNVSLLEDYRNELNNYCRDINTEINNSKLTPHKLVGLLIKLTKEAENFAIPAVELDDFSDWDVERMLRVESFSEKIQAVLMTIGVPDKMTFWGSQLRVLLPFEQNVLLEQFKITHEAIEKVATTSARISTQLELPVPTHFSESLRLLALLQLAAKAPNLKAINIKSGEWFSNQREIEEILNAGESLAFLHEKYKEIFLPEAWEQDVLEMRQNFLLHGGKWYRFLIGDYKKSNARLASLCTVALAKQGILKIEYVDDLLTARRLEKYLSEHQKRITDLFSHRWKGISTDWKKLSEVSHYLFDVHQQINQRDVPKAILDYLKNDTGPEVAKKYYEDLSDLTNHQKSEVEKLLASLEFDQTLRFKNETFASRPFNELLSVISTWSIRISELHNVIAWNNLLDAAVENNVEFLMKIATDWDEARNFLKHAIQKSWYEFLLQQAFISFPSLRKFQRDSHEKIIQQFRKLDKLNLQYNRGRVILKHWEDLPNMQAGGQVGILKYEFNRRARFKPIRKIIEEAGEAIQQIKPVFMMSPLSIANFLPPGSIEFDMVIFDEASQVRPVEALGAILRAKQLIVVGDKKQLPPTNFFDSLMKDSNDDENTTADLESILGMCDSKGCLSKMLRWHYRSLHESLISFSNNQFYENKLVIFPSPGSNYRMGIVFHHLTDTYYDRGKSSTNPKEAEIVAEAVIAHARKNPKQSLGVVAFSTSQRQCIQDALEIKRRNSPDVESFFNNHLEEPFFIKNLENVQGDERDIIFISIGYGRSENGYLSMSFGPLNNEGGEKRLNVLITRAKFRCEIFTNITSDDIDLNRTKQYGIRVLKEFLYFAEHGKLNITEETGKPADSYFELSVADKLIENGYIVRKQVGSQGFYIDLAIVDPENPGRYIIGLECDGASYHSARSARDRDRLRQQVLENIGWTIHRIWSTDWFRHPESELKKVISAIEKAKQKVSVDDIEVEQEQSEYKEQAIFIREEVSLEAEMIPMYECAELSAEITQYELHLYPTGKLAAWMEEVVKVESPVHFDEVSRRMVEAGGVSRIGSRIRDSFQQAAKLLKSRKLIHIKEDFLWSMEMDQPMIRNRANLANSSRKMKFIAPEEISLAIEKVVKDSIAINQDDLAILVGKMFGFNRTTEDMKEIIGRISQQMLKQQVLKLDEGLLKQY